MTEPTKSHTEKFLTALALTQQQVDASGLAPGGRLFFTTLERFVRAFGGTLTVRATFRNTPDETTEYAPTKLLAKFDEAQIVAQMIRGMDEEAAGEGEASQHTTAPGAQTEQHTNRRVRPDAPPVGAVTAHDGVPSGAAVRHQRALLLRWAAGLEEGIAWLSTESISDETRRHARASVTGSVRGIVDYLDGPQTAGLPANLDQLLQEAYELGFDEEGVWHDDPRDSDREVTPRHRSAPSTGAGPQTSERTSC